MKIISSDKDGATIHFTKTEMITLAEVGLEFTQGAFAPSDQEWESLGLDSRKDIADLFAALPLQD